MRKVQKLGWDAVVLSECQCFIQFLWGPILGANIITNDVSEAASVETLVIGRNIKTHLVREP